MHILHKDLSKEGIDTFFYDVCKLSTGFFVAEAWQEPLVHLAQNLLVVFSGQIVDRSVNHHHKDVQDVVSVVSQVKESVDSLLLELFISYRFRSAHSQNHRFVNADGWDPGSLLRWLSAKDKTKVKMEHVSVLSDHQVFKVAIAYC